MFVNIFLVLLTEVDLVEKLDSPSGGDRKHKIFKVWLQWHDFRKIRELVIISIGFGYSREFNSKHRLRKFMSLDQLV